MKRILPLVLVLAAAACMKAPDPPGAPRLQAATDQGRPQFQMVVPEGWQQVEPDQAFYLAKWEIPGGGGANCTVSWLGPGVEAVQANVERWIGQFAAPGGGAAPEPRLRRLEGASQPTTAIEIEGTFMATRSVGGGEPRADWMLAGAVIESASGPLYVKAVGSREVLGRQWKLWAGVARAQTGR